MHSRNQFNMAFKYIPLILLSLLLFALCLNGGNMKNDIQYGKRMLNALIDVASEISFIDCTKECLRRRRCLSVNYWRSISLCEMNSEKSDSKAFTSDSRTVFTNIAPWEKQNSDACSNHPCPINMICTPEAFHGYRCDVADCGPLSYLNNSKEVNVTEAFTTVGIGSLRSLRCQSWAYDKSYTAICASDGNWTSPQDTTCDYMTCSTEFTKFETLHISGKELEVPYIFSMDYKWIVIQRRCFNNTDFYRNWTDYKDGFGNFKANYDFWIGNDIIHLLTTAGYNFLRIEMLKTDDEPIEANYEHFSVEDEEEKYRLNITGFKGGHDCMIRKDSGWGLHGMAFSTFDEDNDTSPYNCALASKSGWWFKSCTCGNLNGVIGKNKTDGMRWACSTSPFCQLKATRVLLRKTT